MRRVATIALVLVLSGLIFTFAAGEFLTSPALSTVGAAPPQLEAEQVTLALANQETMSGWFARGRPGAGAVLLLHGVRSDRRQMLKRALFLKAAGYSVLLTDLPGHGESRAERITFGWREAEGAKAALRFLRQTLADEPLAVIGVSLGAASFVMADDVAPPEAVVLESMYPTLEEAVADRLRMRFGVVGAKLAPLLLQQLPLRLGFTADQLRPIDHLGALRAPVLIASGTLDLHTTEAETRRLFSVAVEPKELWLVEGAAHVDLHAFDSVQYEARVSAFLTRHMKHRGRTEPVAPTYALLAGRVE